jgi:predicted  nucleic acid-binding Zn-ribbon protein
MEFEFSVTEMFDTCIARVENIGELSVGQVMPEGVENALQELMNELIKCKTRAKQRKAIAGEDECDYIRTIARHEKEIPQLDREIKQLREDVTQLQTRLAATQNNLEQTQNELVDLRNDFTRQQNDTQNQLGELRAIVNQIRNN